ncbi:MAG: ABC transporter ATP-binding protein [Phycisphaerae bacterium]|nr:ABC transporter ATP-binding protein [Phycisphaerae bacterium]
MTDRPRLIDVSDLTVVVRAAGAELPAVDRVSFHVDRAETVALVGESGSGKTLAALALMNLLPDGVRRSSGSIRLDGRELSTLSPREWRTIRGSRIAMVFQEPMTALNPLMRIADQVAEAARGPSGERLPPDAARREAIELLRSVGIADAALCADRYPHELSGGMRQRVLIAMAIAGRPDLLIADEPTTALDVTIQAQILALLKSLRRGEQMGMLVITHDFGIVAELADRVVVLYAGRVAEAGQTRDVLRRPLHPYTRGLLECMPVMQASATRLPVINGCVPGIADRPCGCRFHPRCTLGRDDPTCISTEPALAGMGGDRLVACWKAAT